MDGHKSREVRLHEHDEFDRQGDWQKCLLYLITWAIHNPRYYCLRLWIAKDGEISASYYETWGGPLTYFVCGVRHTDGTYSTHS